MTDNRAIFSTGYDWTWKSPYERMVEECLEIKARLIAVVGEAVTKQAAQDLTDKHGVINADFVKEFGEIATAAEDMQSKAGQVSERMSNEEQDAWAAFAAENKIDGIDIDDQADAMRQARFGTEL